MNIEIEKLRMKLWCDTYVSVSNANDCKSPDSAVKFADEAVIAFDKRVDYNGNFKIR